MNFLQPTLDDLLACTFGGAEDGVTTVDATDLGYEAPANDVSHDVSLSDASDDVGPINTTYEPDFANTTYQGEVPADTRTEELTFPAAVVAERELDPFGNLRTPEEIRESERQVIDAGIDDGTLRYDDLGIVQRETPVRPVGEPPEPTAAEQQARLVEQDSSGAFRTYVDGGWELRQGEMKNRPDVIIARNPETGVEIPFHMRDGEAVPILNMPTVLRAWGRERASGPLSSAPITRGIQELDRANRR